MTRDKNHTPDAPSHPTGVRSWISRHGFVLTGFVLIAGYFLWTEHRAHVLAFSSWLPWLLLALCPLMHLFMHHGHGGHGGQGHDADDKGEDK
jgi:hypothetical protein